MMKIQNRKISGSLRNRVHSQWNSSEWNQVSTCVMEGCAIIPKPTNPMLSTQAEYLKALIGHLFLRVERFVSWSRSA